MPTIDLLMENSSTSRTSDAVDFDFKLPPLPQTMVSAARLTGDNAVDDRIAELKKIVAVDPIVTAKTLRRVNSVYYGLHRRVGSVEQAVVLLGFEEIHKLITTAGLIKLEEVFNNRRQCTIFQRIIRRSIAVASFANVLGQELCLNCAHLSYTSGILHAVGRIVLLYNDPTVYEKLWWTSGGAQAPAIDKERSLYYVTYARLGEQACKTWELPETIALAIGHHLDPPRMDNDRALETLALAICASRGWANNLMRREHPDIPTLKESGPEIRALKRLAFHQNRNYRSLKNFLDENEDDVRRFVEMVMPQDPEA